ncbi:MAG: glycosyltransferase family 2 protein, partial [Acidobacteriota bacterium]
MKSSDIPKITFGIIVLNGEPFTRYCLRSIYPYAHQIIVVEGASPGAAQIATPDGHSTDGTLEILHRFKKEEDPGNKMQIITRDGFWSEKDEQSEAYAKAATGDFLWQIDIDEFYKDEDIGFIMDMLKNDPEITMISFPSITFWGGFDYVANSWYLKNGGQICHRLFQWKPGYKYVTHRPATVTNLQGQDLRSLKWVGPNELEPKEIIVFHYSLVFPKQVREKALYYSNAPWVRYAQGVVQWAENNFLNPVSRPYQVHNVHMHPSWIERFHGSHPKQIQNLQNHLRSGEIQIECRNNRDIEMFESRIIYR